MDLANLTCIDLDLPEQTGFRNFMSAWLYRDQRISFLVDPGPLSTIPQLLLRLRASGVDALDYVLLTHIHIDHAGGTGALLEHFPEARVICHPDAVSHMVEPTRLWQGTRQVLGALADAYGEILPVPASRIGFTEQLGTAGPRAYLTPGHAPHHCCYLIDDLLFGGEVAGVRCDVQQGIYMRPATPPKFLFEVARNSLERMIDLCPRILVFAHYGLVDSAVEHLQTGHAQLSLWIEGLCRLRELPAAVREEAFFQWLLTNDPCFKTYEQLSTDIQVRERLFLGNTLRGMQAFIESPS